MLHEVRTIPPYATEHVPTGAQMWYANTAFGGKTKMRDGCLEIGRLQLKVLTGLVLALGLVLGACGGGTQEQQREATWTPRERAPSVAEHWWHEPVEHACEADSDCPRGERCRNMRLGTCDGCPPGEVTRICVGEGSSSTRARAN